MTSSNLQSNTTRYVVCDDHTLGYITDLEDVVGILQTSVLKGATFELWPDPKPTSMFTLIRPATRADFSDFRVQPPHDFE